MSTTVIDHRGPGPRGAPFDAVDQPAAGRQAVAARPERSWLWCCCVAMAWAALVPRVPAEAQSTRWDSLLTNSHWYVPAANLLAYEANASSLASPRPMSDQTLWSIGSASHGVFTGVAIAMLNSLPVPVVSTTTTTLIAPGFVTDGGQIRMRFAAVPSGPVTVGIGQMRDQGGTTLMEMQMITGNGHSFVTHWAFMADYDPATFTPPVLFPGGTLLSQEWRWTAGSTWHLQDDGLFGAGLGTFTIADYRNGYFWGSGDGPAGSPAATFTHMGSITPEGDVLFAVLAGGTLTSLAGRISGTGMSGTMMLRAYDGEHLGDAGHAIVVSVATPEIDPAGTAGAIALVCGAFGLFERRRRQCRGWPPSAATCEA